MESLLTKIQSSFSKWSDSFWNILPNLCISVLIFIALVFLAKFLKRFYLKLHRRIMFKRYGKTELSSSEKRTPLIIAGIIYIIPIIIGFLIVVESLQLGGLFTKLLTGVGVIGIILGVALQGMASSLFASFLLSIERPFNIGDEVILNNIMGRVMDIGFISTKLLSLSGEIVFVPNQIIFSQPFTNLNASGKRRIIVNLGLSYDMELPLAKEKTIETISRLSFVEKEDPIDVHYTQVSASTYDYTVRFWIDIKNIGFLEARSEAIMALKKCYDEQGIDLAYSTITLDFSSPTLSRLQSVIAPKKV